tara:strand:+ start:201 stop:1346 length:1146 start_codon:yes stop_codon:yes gene_type:complete
MSLITETNAQYYAGQQAFVGAGTAGPVITTFNTDLVSYLNNAPTSNFSVLVNNVLLVEGTDYSLTGANTITFLAGSFPAVGASIIVQLNQTAKNNNYGGYEYIKLNDVINNFLVAYVGPGKLIPNVKRTDIMFHAKRGLQEFSYDTLKSIKSQELTIPASLSVIIPQDYVNYVRVSWVDDAGVQRIIYPVNNLTSNPTDLPIQDADGIPTQGSLGQNLQADQALIEERWKKFNLDNLDGRLNMDFENTNVYNYDWWKLAYGERYGLEPQYSQQNGYFSINERLGTFSFSGGLANKLITLQYISDGLAYDADTKVPKLAEEAMYMHIAYGVLSGRANIPEYIINRFKREKSSKLRNAKIRLSNIKLEEFSQVMRGKSKWIKH